MILQLGFGGCQVEMNLMRTVQILPLVRSKKWTIPLEHLVRTDNNACS